MKAAGEKAGLIEAGAGAGDSDMFDEDAIWIRHSGDKVDIAAVMMGVIRQLYALFPRDEPLSALSIGSGSEPQLRILEAAFAGGLYLLDIDEVPLDDISKRAKDQWMGHVRTIQGDYNVILASDDGSSSFLRGEMGGCRPNLVTLHHSLYYSRAESWKKYFLNMLGSILAPVGAVHAVLMSSQCREKDSTTWLYDHFAGEFFGARNDQDLRAFGKELANSGIPGDTSLRQFTHTVKFFVDDFRKFMSVVWMILLYPDVHMYTHEQRIEITEYMYDEFWIPKKPLIQMQDHLVIVRNGEAKR